MMSEHESVQEDTKDKYKLWRGRLEREKKAHEKYHKEADEAEKAARSEGDDNSFNIQWSNCRIKRSAIFANRPIADVRKRHTTRNENEPPDPSDKELARLMERAIDYQIDVGSFDSHATATVKDYVETGLCLPRVNYDVETRLNPDPVAIAWAEALGEDPPTEIVSQKVSIEHIPRSCIRWEPGRTSWDAVNWVAIKSYHQRKEVNKKYGVKIKSGLEENDQYERRAKKYSDEVVLYEIYDKSNRQIIVLAASHPKILETRKDTLSLQRFYPFPRPAMANIKSDELIPRPDYYFVKPQIEELNVLTKRISSIVKQIKPNGFYDASIKGLADVMDAADGSLKPVSGLKEFLDGGGLKDGIQFIPLQEKIETVIALESQREQVKQQIYEILGISDIIRGATKASETAMAQQIKGQWANVRLSEDTGEIARLWRETFRIMAEIMSEHFDPIQLQLMTGIEVTEQMQQIMQSDIGRSYSIDIETDSTILRDDQEDRQATVDLVESINGYLEQTIPGVISGVLPPSFVVETLLFMVSKHKNGKQLEDSISELGPHLTKMLQFQQQMQQLQGQLQQAGEAIQQRDMQLQQAGEQIDGMGKQLQQFNERDEARKDQKERREDGKEQREGAETRSKIQDTQTDNQMDAAKTRADIELTGEDAELRQAQTAKTWKEVSEPPQTRGV